MLLQPARFLWIQCRQSVQNTVPSAPYLREDVVLQVSHGHELGA